MQGFPELTEQIRDVRTMGVTEYIPRNFLRSRHPNLAWVGAFLRALAEGATAKRAADVAGVHRAVAYAERDENPAFRAAWEEAAAEGTDAFEDVAGDRAKEKSDLLMMYVLKARNPARFNEKAQATKGNSISISIEHHYPERSTEAVTIEVNRADAPDSKQLASAPTKRKRVSARKDKS